MKTKNSKAQQELMAYAKKENVNIEELFTNNKYADNVADIFYKAMPKLVKLTYSQKKFREYYKSNPEQFAPWLAKK